ncbi:MAG: YncE family protein [Bacteroidia bacterium]|nr:YncE family protein [Bacteroidia bacterium]
MKRSGNIGLNSLTRRLKKIFSETEKSKEDNFVQKTYEGTEDNFFEATNTNLRVTLGLDKKSESYEKDVKRFGTKIKLIDVADDAIPNKRIKEVLPLKKPYKRKCFDEKYEKDLERFGTRQGIIRVSNDNCKKKKDPVYSNDFSKAISKCKPRETTSYSANPFSDIYRDCPKVQVTIQNKSTEEKEVVLWGANQNISVSAPAPGDVQDHTIVAQISIPAGVHPQGIVVNPVNQLVYVANQLSGSVTVLDGNNQVVKVIQLQPSFPGFSSPVALAVNTNSASATYGHVFVAGSVSNIVSVIDLSLNVVVEIGVGVRPVAIAFNPINKHIYVATLSNGNFSVIDTETLAHIPGSPFLAGADPIAIGIHPVNGEIYIANYFTNSVSVYSPVDNLLVANIVGINQKPVSITYNPANGGMYVVAESGFVYQIDPATHTIIGLIQAGNSPRNSFFNTLNNFLYVQNRGDNTFTIIRPDNSKIDGVSLGTQNFGGAYNSFNNTIYVSDTSNNTINAIGYLTVSSTVSTNSDYPEMREDFQSNPAIIQHTKFVVTGLERLNSFRVNNFTPTGSIKSKPISFELYASPQSKLNVAEVTELAGTVIDGKMNWRFKLPGLHTVSILVWYRQFEVREILSPTNNKSIIKNQ